MPLSTKSVPRKEDPALQPGVPSTGHCVGLAMGWGQEGVQHPKLPHFYGTASRSKCRLLLASSLFANEA